jgi:hypothetical protein
MSTPRILSLGNPYHKNLLECCLSSGSPPTISHDLKQQIFLKPVYIFTFAKCKLNTYLCSNKNNNTGMDNNDDSKMH